MIKDLIEVFKGNPSPLGFSFHEGRSNFALFAQHASRVHLGVFLGETVREFPMERSGDIWHIALTHLPSEASYSFRCEGPFDEKNGYLYFPQLWLADPYSKIPDSHKKWGESEKSVRAFCQTPRPFDWQGVKRPQIPLQDLIIYEMHVRGFTRSSSSETKHPGTFLGLIEKIPYLKKLGVNAVELLPIFEFDEMHTRNHHPETGDLLPNYWGYNPLYFFAPMRRYAFSEESHGPIEEFKTLVRELHRNGIEIFLDVVYNHTGEGKEKDYVFHFRGIDNAAYYLLDEKGALLDFTGCGNTINSQHPAVQNLILDNLHYWVEEMGVDGFRFDLASILTRGPTGAPLEDPPLFKAIQADPRLRKAKFIAEAWDAAGLYQVGSFPKWGPWSEWNDRYREKTRRFLKGTEGYAGSFASVITGSEFLYGSSHSPLCSINFITAHDGFSLRDLVSYEEKHNSSNGEMNRDGSDSNDSWNCGVEGPTSDPAIFALRERQMRNFFLALFISQGIPMLLMGDEYGHTRQGNNNPYVQDNEINWFLWDELKKQNKIFDYVSSLIAFRKNTSLLRHTRFLTKADIDWHGPEPFEPNWNPSSRLIAFTLKAEHPLYLAFNAADYSQLIHLPPGLDWREIVNTEKDWDSHHLRSPGKGETLPFEIELAPYSALMAHGTSHHKMAHHH